MVKLTKKECGMLWKYVKREYNNTKYLEQNSKGKLKNFYAKEAAAWKTLVDVIEAETGYSGEPRKSDTYFEVRYGDERIAYAKTFTEAKTCAEDYCRTLKGDYTNNLYYIDIFECECGNCVSVKSMFDNE